MQKSRKKHPIIGRIILGILILLIIAGGVYCRFGGFGTGKCADTAEFAKYAGQVSEITIPEEARIIALGEATHGNAEFSAVKAGCISDYGGKIWCQSLCVRSRLRLL